MKIVFFGSSAFSLPALRACITAPHQLVKVISTPDQKKGRGLEETPTPVKQFAADHTLPCICPDTLKSPELLDSIRALNPDLFVVSSYGKMIPSGWLKIPSQLCLNVHPSLLPKYRGAAPIHWPILNGDPATGLTIAEVTPQLDAGDIFYQEKHPLTGSSDSESMSQFLAERSYHALLNVFDLIQNQKMTRTPQTETDMCYARKLVKEDGIIHWEDPAQKISNQVRGLKPWPLAYTTFRQQPLIVTQGSIPALPSSANAPAGSVIKIGRGTGAEIACGKGSFILEKVKPAGKKEMPALDFINGARLTEGFRFPS